MKNNLIKFYDSVEGKSTQDVIDKILLDNKERISKKYSGLNKKMYNFIVKDWNEYTTKNYKDNTKIDFIKKLLVINEYNKYKRNQEKNLPLRIMMLYIFEKYNKNIDMQLNPFYTVRQAISNVLDNKQDYFEMYNMLNDDMSKNILVNILNYRVSFKPDFYYSITDYNNVMYYDKNIITLTEDEVFVDIGAYNGDSILEFIKNTNGYKKIFCYEPNIELLNEAKNNLKKYDNIEYRQVGISNKNDILKFSRNNMLQINNDGEISLKVVKLDDDVKEKVTYIKMDIEGEEYNALSGAKETIKKYHPKLAISLYHKVDDLNRIIKLINDTDSTYKFYLRRYPVNLPQYYWSELVLYCI